MPPKIIKRLLLPSVISLVLVLLAIFITVQLTPWPGAMLIRFLFESNAAKVSSALRPHVPTDVSSKTNFHYDTNDQDAYLDVYYPTYIEGTDRLLPTIVWIHGGAWLSGSKDDVANYLKILSSSGYTVVGVNYSLAPSAHFPTQTEQINNALGYLQENASLLHIDSTNIILAGDSAGANLAAQEALVITSEFYSQKVGTKPSIPPESLKGVILACGPYDLKLAHYDGLVGLFLTEVLWSYTGIKNFLHDTRVEPISVINYVDSKFPPTFITVGNADPLKLHSEKLAEKLDSLGVPVDTLFFVDDYQPSLGHEYQFNLDKTGRGGLALVRITRFMNEITTIN